MRSLQVLELVNPVEFELYREKSVLSKERLDVATDSLLKVPDLGRSL